MIVFSDEDGNAVREQLKDSDVLARYKTMRETLIYLSNLDHEDTESQMLDKLRQQVLRVFKVSGIDAMTIRSSSVWGPHFSWTC